MGCMIPKGTRVHIITRNGACVVGTLLYDASLDYGSQFPVVRTDHGVVYNYRHAVATYPNGREFEGIPSPVSMAVIK